MVTSSVKKIALLTASIGIFGAALHSVNQKVTERMVGQVSMSALGSMENVESDEIETVNMIQVLTPKDKLNIAARTSRLKKPIKLAVPNQETAVLKYQPYVGLDEKNPMNEHVSLDEFSRALQISNARASATSYKARKQRTEKNFIALISPDELLRHHSHEMKMLALARDWVQRPFGAKFDVFASNAFSRANRLMRETSQKIELASNQNVKGSSYLGGLLVALKTSSKERSKVRLAKLENKTRKSQIIGRKKRSKTEPSLVLAYAATKEKSDAPFGKVIVEGSRKARLDVNKGDHAWVKLPLPKHTASSNELKCLARGVYFEARGESQKGMAAVAQVILNRVKNPTYPKTICGVVYQNKQLRNRCQFSFACDGIPDVILSPSAWRKAKRIAKESVEGKHWIKSVGSSTHYHATYVRPRWASTMKRMNRIGLHIFYRTYGGGWS